MHLFFFCFVTLELDIWIYLFLFQTIVVSNRDKNNKKIEDGLISTKIGIQFCKIVNGRKLILLNAGFGSRAISRAAAAAAES